MSDRDLGIYQCLLRTGYCPGSRGIIALPEPVASAKRKASYLERAQALLIDAHGRYLQPLFGDGSMHNSFRLGDPVYKLYEASLTAPAPEPYQVSSGGFRAGCWDGFTGDVFLIDGYAVVRVNRNGTVTVIAGKADVSKHADGNGWNARFFNPQFLASDGKGAIYIADDHHIRKLQLHDSWRAGESAAHSSTWPLQATVTTIHAATIPIAGLAYSAAGDSLMYVAGPAVRTLPLSAPAPSRTAAGVEFRRLWAQITDADDGEYVVDEAEEGEEEEEWESTDDDSAEGEESGGEGEEEANEAGGEQQQQQEEEEEEDEDDGEDSTGSYETDSQDTEVFEDADLKVSGFAMDGDGTCFFAEGCSVQMVAPGGAVSTVAACSQWRQLRVLGVLRCGCLAAAHTGGLLLLGLALPPPPLPGAPAAAPPPRSLSSDLGCLLSRQPDGSADLLVAVEGRTFPAHRAILAARSDYFRTRLAPGFADGAAPELSLPEASAAAFELVLRHIYTGHVDIPDDQARVIAELADRLLLPELCRQAQERVLASVGVGNIVETLLWADSRGPAFAGLMGELKAWYLDHCRGVAAHARDSLTRLAAAAPELMVELHLAGLRGEAGRGRRGA